MKNKYQVLASAFSRQQWIEKFRNEFEGALGEYAKLKYAELVGDPDHWSDEVSRLMAKIKELFNPVLVKKKSSFDLDEAAAEAFLEASGAQEQLTQARNEYASKYIKTVDKRRAFLEMTRNPGWDSGDLALEMLERHYPELFNRIVRQIQIVS